MCLGNYSSGRESATWFGSLVLNYLGLTFILVQEFSTKLFRYAESDRNRRDSGEDLTVGV